MLSGSSMCLVTAVPACKSCKTPHPRPPQGSCAFERAGAKRPAPDGSNGDAAVKKSKTAAQSAASPAPAKQSPSKKAAVKTGNSKAASRQKPKPAKRGKQADDAGDDSEDDLQARCLRRLYCYMPCGPAPPMGISVWRRVPLW